MSKSTDKPHWLDKKSHVAWLWRFFLLLLVLSVLASTLAHGHPYFEIDAVFGFHAWFAFMACFAALVLAKVLAFILRRSDTYYEDCDG
jgi:uncharacterized membrane protein